MLFKEQESGGREAERKDEERERAATHFGNRAQLVWISFAFLKNLIHFDLFHIRKQLFNNYFIMVCVKRNSTGEKKESRERKRESH